MAMLKITFRYKKARNTAYKSIMMKNNADKHLISSVRTIPHERCTEDFILPSLSVII